MSQLTQEPFWKVLNLPIPNSHLTVADYDQLPPTSIMMELIHGVVIYPHWSDTSMSPAPTPEHQNIVLNVAAWLKTHTTHGQTFIAPLDVAITDTLRLQPDVMWIAPDSNCAVTDTILQGAPDLVIEVLSPSTAVRDKTDKFDLYEQHGVREYWIIDPRDHLIEVYHRVENGFQRLGGFGQQAQFQSPLLNITVQPRHFF